MSAKLRNPAIAKLVERQMRNWEIARAQRETDPPPRSSDAADFIAISREAGIGGGEIADGVGMKLGWPVFDKVILHVMAGDDGIRRQLYATMDERDISWFEGTLRVFMEPAYARNDYFRQLLRTVLSLARQGPAVFLGRGIGFMLPRTSGFRVRLVASLDYRIQAFAQRENISLDQARDEIVGLERQRGDFIQAHFDADPADPHGYDILLNLDHFDVPRAIDTILHARGVHGEASRFADVEPPRTAVPETGNLAIGSYS